MVAKGTGRNAYIPNYRVGGKTGTAQKVKDGKYLSGNYITSFIGFLPADDPEVVVYIAVDNAKGVTQYGGTIAAPIAKNILNASISALNIKEKYDGMTKEYKYGDQKYFYVEDVIGLSSKEASKTLKNFKVLFSGNGSKVIYQEPKAGSYIIEGEVVRLMLGDD